MPKLLTAALCFLLLHRLVSGSPLRTVIVARIGESMYGRLFQLATIASLIWFGVAYANATSPFALQLLWRTNSLWNSLQVILQPIAVFFIISGFTAPNPGTFGREHTIDQADVVRGVLRITRHPFLWGIAIFATGHLMASPTMRNLILFGTLIFVALTGTLSIDAKRSRSLGSKWAEFASRTSNLPFGAIASGQQRLALSELSVRHVVVALLVTALLALAHQSVIGVSALP
jgi:uncharacterized membrane protein